jgi:hypothetical protein
MVPSLPSLSPPEMALTEKLDLNTKQDPRSRRRKGGGPSGILENKHDARQKRKKKPQHRQDIYVIYVSAPEASVVMSDGHGRLLSHRARCA